MFFNIPHCVKGRKVDVGRKAIIPKIKLSS